MSTPAITVALAMVILMFVGCAAITQEEAVAIATREIARRDRPLPKHYLTSVKAVSPSAEEGASGDLWYVVFTTPDGKTELYAVSVYKYHHKVEDFLEPKSSAAVR